MFIWSIKVVIWFLVHHPHQIITIASFHHYWHCACVIMLFVSLQYTYRFAFKGLISTLVVSLTLPNSISYGCCLLVRGYKCILNLFRISKHHPNNRVLQCKTIYPYLEDTRNRNHTTVWSDLICHLLK